MLKRMLTLLLFAGLWGCNGESPTSVPMNPVVPPPVVEGHVFGIVRAESACALGATIEILDGPQAGQRILQGYDECEYSTSEGFTFSYRFQHLTLNSTAIRIRASMPGFQSQEKSAVAVAESEFGKQYTVDFDLVKLSP